MIYKSSRRRTRIKMSGDWICHTRTVDININEYITFTRKGGGSLSLERRLAWYINTLNSSALNHSLRKFETSMIHDIQNQLRWTLTVHQEWLPD